MAGSLYLSLSLVWLGSYFGWLMVFAECFLISSCFVDQDWPQLYLIDLYQVTCPLVLLRLVVGCRLDYLGCNDRLV